MTITRAFAVATTFCLAPLTSHAATFDVAYTDNDGPQWTGIVDSTTDTFTILSWAEGAGGIGYWTPTSASLPLLFNAVTAALDPFDVPDDWDGTIGNNWGFLSDLIKSDIEWQEGNFSGNNSHLGWGISQVNNGSISSSVGESYFLYTPRSSTGNYLSTANSVSVTSVPSPVPLPAAGFLLIGALGSISLLRGRKKS
ncbi:hypothetical protein DL239_17580 [Sedimentitalea sp. CY04]|uniref:VPLPA-CTERM sorting domain-containing protein n=1 Tax=Parasedimentitalea denitrificans TaxID=2211118 RepID=A0ABX0WAT3_9RHOB|nr:VPLPA-CTERM sorting domain-containing protein [Sedimentitalea sp. CY04]NIZ62783.1 hypothetical protein [Sedimentitalea sp. CY04]